jgi:hypothetical protein
MNREQLLEQARQASLNAWAEAQRKALHEAIRNTPVGPVAAAASGTGSGGATIPSNVIEFVVNTWDDTYFYFNFNTVSAINFTIEWGDGTTHVDEGSGGYYAENHTYPELGQQYTARIYFSDISLVTAINFPGND